MATCTLFSSSDSFSLFLSPIDAEHREPWGWDSQSLQSSVESFQSFLPQFFGSVESVPVEPPAPPEWEQFDFPLAEADDDELGLFVGSERAECPICYSIMRPAPVTIHGCNHTLCESCLLSAIQTDANAFRTPCCPFFECRMPLAPGDIARSSSSTLLLTQRFIRQELKAFNCPGSKCGAQLVGDCCEATKIGSCPVCNTRICVGCKDAVGDDELEEVTDSGAEKKVHCCKEKKKKLELPSFLDEALVGLEGDWTHCPCCRQAILRSEGCNHITCVCTVQFCFFCRRIWGNGHHEECPCEIQSSMFAKGTFPYELIFQLYDD